MTNKRQHGRKMVRVQPIIAEAKANEAKTTKNLELDLEVRLRQAPTQTPNPLPLPFSSPDDTRLLTLERRLQPRISRWHSTLTNPATMTSGETKP